MAKKPVGAFAHLSARDRQAPDLERASKSSESGRSIQTVHWSELYSETQVRTVFKRIEDLAETIRLHGQEEPVKVHPKDDNGYLIRRGERRWRACRLLDSTVDIVVVDPRDDAKEVVLQLVENLQKDELNPIDEARAYQTLKNDYGLKQRELAEACGVPEQRVSKSLRLLRMDERLQSLMLEEIVNDRDTLNLLDSLSESDSELFQALCNRAEENGSLTRNDVRKAINEAAAGETTPKSQPAPVPDGYKTRKPGNVSIVCAGTDDRGQQVEGKARLDIVADSGYVMVQVGDDDQAEFTLVPIESLMLKDLIG